MHLRYDPTDFDVVLRGTDNNARCPTSRYSFDWNVTHNPSQSGIILLWFGDNSLEMRERGMYDGLSMPRHAL